MRISLLLLAMGATTVSAVAADFSYMDGTSSMTGYLATPKMNTKSKGAVLIVHDWNGLDAYEKMRADLLAAKGYVALAIDVYGTGIRPKTVAECSTEAGKYYRDPNLLHRRLAAGLRAIQGVKGVDSKQITAIGYCFGGTAVLEMARAGMTVKNVVSFHGGLAPLSKGVDPIKANVFVFHGQADTLVPEDQVKAFTAEMLSLKANLKFMSYPGAKHAFSVKGSDSLGVAGVGYNADADRRSWTELLKLLSEK